HLGIALAVLLVAVLALVLALVPEVRRAVLLLYRRAHVRRQWTLAVRHAGLANFNDRVPGSSARASPWPVTTWRSGYRPARLSARSRTRPRRSPRSCASVRSACTAAPRTPA